MPHLKGVVKPAVAAIAALGAEEGVQVLVGDGAALPALKHVLVARSADAVPVGDWEVKWGSQEGRVSVSECIPNWLQVAKKQNAAAPWRLQRGHCRTSRLAAWALTCRLAT